VADDPILTQKITNGHAARMRYSRFRSAMLGLEPQKRNRQNSDTVKARVTKKRKDEKAGKKKQEVEGEEVAGAQVKPDPAASTATPASNTHFPTPDVPSPRVKEEQAQRASQSRSISLSQSPSQPNSLNFYPQPSSTNLSTTQSRMNARFLTPSSDTDLPVTTICAAHNFAAHSPSPDPSEMLQSDPALEFTEDYVHYDDDGRWHQSSPAAFNSNFTAGGGDTAIYQSPLCDQHRSQPVPLTGMVGVDQAHHYLHHAGMHQPSPEDAGIAPSGLMLSQGSSVFVKEEWDTQRY
jgi:hypothetical protein